MDNHIHELKQTADEHGQCANAQIMIDDDDLKYFIDFSTQTESALDITFSI